MEQIIFFFNVKIKINLFISIPHHMTPLNQRILEMYQKEYERDFNFQCQVAIYVINETIVVAPYALYYMQMFAHQVLKQSLAVQLRCHITELTHTHKYPQQTLVTGLYHLQGLWMLKVIERLRPRRRGVAQAQENTCGSFLPALRQSVCESVQISQCLSVNQSVRRQLHSTHTHTPQKQELTHCHTHVGDSGYARN